MTTVFHSTLQERNRYKNIYKHVLNVNYYSINIISNYLRFNITTYY